MKIKNFIVSTAILSAFLLPSILALAQGTANPNPGTGNPPPPPVTINVKLENPFKGGNSIYNFINILIDNIIIPLGGVISVLMIMYAGFMYVTARGDTGKIATAHTALLYGAIGAAILLGAKTISLVIQNTVNQLK